MPRSTCLANASGREEIMQVTARFFAMCREVTGTDTQVLTLPPLANGETFWDEILLLHPDLGPYRTSSRLAVNQEYRNTHARLSDGDEIGIIPPVSGG